MKSTGLVLAAGAIAAANEVVFAPAANLPIPGGTGTVDAALSNFNWRLIPATAILALVLGGLEKLSPTLAVGFGGLTLLAVLIVPVGNAPSPIENVSKMMGY